MDTQNARVMVDLCYLGTTMTPLNVNFDHKCVDTIFFSLSKVYGVYFHRIGGVFTKSNYLGLVGNQWFKNLFSLELGIELLKKYSVEYFPKKYQHIQQQAVYELNMQNPEATIIPSDVIILATAKGYHSQWQEYLRKPLAHYRFCLTPLMDKIIKK